MLAVIGAINTLAFWLSIETYKYMSIWQQSLFSLLTPVISGIFAYFILGEALNVSIIFSLILMGAGLAISLK
jgi:drug/metabolite transporter (DMT)-like permease